MYPTVEIQCREKYQAVEHVLENWENLCTKQKIPQKTKCSKMEQRERKKERRRERERERERDGGREGGEGERDKEREGEGDRQKEKEMGENQKQKCPDKWSTKLKSERKRKKEPQPLPSTKMYFDTSCAAVQLDAVSNSDGLSLLLHLGWGSGTA